MGRWFSVLAHCTFVLGVNVGAPSWSHSKPSTLVQVPTSALTATRQLTDRNWHGFWRHHLGQWKGRWTRYTASGNVKETFASTRHFTANPASTDIVQNNSYRYANGRSIEDSGLPTSGITVTQMALLIQLDRPL